MSANVPRRPGARPGVNHKEARFSSQRSNADEEAAVCISNEGIDRRALAQWIELRLARDRVNEGSDEQPTRLATATQERHSNSAVGIGGNSLRSAG
jgi:hypothetical protein